LGKPRIDLWVVFACRQRRLVACGGRRHTQRSGKVLYSIFGSRFFRSALKERANEARRIACAVCRLVCQLSMRH
jgi:hypothetical protein